VEADCGVGTALYESSLLACVCCQVEVPEFIMTIFDGAKEACDVVDNRTKG
jgi:hypothetical protein